jgi:hypothetical protein
MCWRGKVSGIVCGRTVALQTSSKVDADLHHMALLIERDQCSRGGAAAPKASKTSIPFPLIYLDLFIKWPAPAMVR